MDLNGTGLNESFAVVSDTANELRVLANDQVGGFLAVTYSVDKNPGFLLADDFDGVGNDNDLILMHGKSNFISYFEGDNALPTPAYSKTLVTVSRDPFAAAAGDVTGTTALDVVVASQEYRAVSILANNGSGSFSYSVIGFTATPTFPLLVPPAFNFSTSTTKSDLILLQPCSDRVVILTNTNP